MTAPRDDLAHLLGDVTATAYATGAAIAIGAAVSLFPAFLRPYVERRLLAIVNSEHAGELLCEQFARTLTNT